MVEYKTGTIKSFSQQLGISYPATAGLIKSLMELNLATKIGTEQLEIKKKGKRSYIYSIPSSISLEFFDSNVELETDTYELPK